MPEQQNPNPNPNPNRKHQQKQPPSPKGAGRRTRPGAPAMTAGRKIAVTTVVVALAVVTALASVSAFGRPDTGGGGGGGGADAAAAAEQQEQPDERLLALARRDADDPYALGAADAPVVMIEYSDFQCPFCGKFARDTKPTLVEKYVADGTLRIEWRQFPLFGEESERAARASYAAGRQGRFWEFHDVVYGTERKKNSGAFAQDEVERMAAEAGVKDLNRFAKDMRSGAATAALGADTDEGYALGVSSTPAFLINGTPVVGAQPAEHFAATIERARDRAAAAARAADADRGQDRDRDR